MLDVPCFCPTLLLQSFTSAGGDETWETFVLPNEVLRNYVDIIAVEGPDEDDYPILRVNDCRILGEMDTAGSSWVRKLILQSLLRRVGSASTSAWYNACQKRLARHMWDKLSSGPPLLEPGL